MASRRPYRRASSSSASDRDPDLELDETQQEEVITSLRDHDVKWTERYRIGFTVFSLAITLFFLPPLMQGPGRLVALLSISSLVASAWSVYAVPYAPKSGPDGPIEAYLPILNGALAGLLVVYGILAWRRGHAVESLVPGLMYAITTVVRRELKPADIDGLAKLRYRFKGA